MIKVYALAFVSVAVLVTVVWFFFIRPLGREDHERRLEMIRRKIEARERRREATGSSEADPD